jgi:hypothetical protein
MRRYSPSAGGAGTDLGPLTSRVEVLEGQITQPGAPSGSFISTGGQVSYTGEGLDLVVSAAEYTILGAAHASPETPISLAAADPVLDRVDAIVLTTANTVVVVEGTPAEAPVLANIDPFTQILTRFVSVPAGAVTLPGITRTLVYAENAGTGGGEWAATGSAAIAVGADVDPLTGVTHIQATAAGTGASLTFAPAAPVDLSAAGLLVLNLMPTAAWPKGRGLTVFFRNADAQRVGRAVVISAGAYGFQAGLINYQLVAIPMGDLALPDGTLVTDLRMEVSGSGQTIGWRMDDVAVEEGSLEPPASGVPFATRFVHGIVRTDVTRADPQVYTSESADDRFGLRLLPIKVIAAGPYAFVLEDLRQYLAFTSAAAVAATMPPNVFPIGALVPFRQVGAGAITLVEGAGVTITPKDGQTLVSDGPGSLVQLVQRAANVWDAFGDLAAG